MRTQHSLTLRCLESIPKLENHNLRIKKDPSVLTSKKKNPYFVYKATKAKRDQMACLRSHLLLAKLGTPDSLISVKDIIILPATLVQILRRHMIPFRVRSIK